MHSTAIEGNTSSKCTMQEQMMNLDLKVTETLSNITENGIENYFSHLQNMGLLRREGRRKLGQWAVVE